MERATLHNENEVNRLGLSVGETVRLKRSGDVIPKIVSIEDKTSELHPTLQSVPSLFASYRLPVKCPECGSPTDRVAGGKVVLPGVADCSDDRADGVVLPVTVRCTGGAAVCPAQVIEQIR